MEDMRQGKSIVFWVHMQKVKVAITKYKIYWKKLYLFYKLIHLLANLAVKIGILHLTLLLIFEENLLQITVYYTQYNF